MASTTAWLDRAEEALTAARSETTPQFRYRNAYLAAARAAAAVFAERGNGPADGAILVDIWTHLPQLAPELADWARTYDLRSEARATADAGIRQVRGEEADGEIDDAAHFLTTVSLLLGIGGAR
jgi:hypothetical protein